MGLSLPLRVRFSVFALAACGPGIKISCKCMPLAELHIPSGRHCACSSPTSWRRVPCHLTPGAFETPLGNLPMIGQPPSPVAQLSALIFRRYAWYNTPAEMMRSRPPPPSTPRPLQAPASETCHGLPSCHENVNAYGTDITGCEADRASRTSLRLPILLLPLASSPKSESTARTTFRCCSCLLLFAGGGVTGSSRPAILGCHTGAGPGTSSSSITLSTLKAVGTTLPLRLGIGTRDKLDGTCTSGSQSTDNKAEW